MLDRSVSPSASTRKLPRPGDDGVGEAGQLPGPEARRSSWIKFFHELGGWVEEIWLGQNVEPNPSFDSVICRSNVGVKGERTMLRSSEGIGSKKTEEQGRLRGRDERTWQGAGVKL
eukprot:765153-Hanusia_phi.AAC.1